MRSDPFAIKRFSKLHPARLVYTLWARIQDRLSGLRFQHYALPVLPIGGELPAAPHAAWEETQVTPEQARTLIRALHLTDGIPGCIVEIGSWRGVSTSYLAAETQSPVFGIDPYIGEAAGEHMKIFQERTREYPHVHLIRKPCGAALKEWAGGKARFVFIDGSHDYANVAHDLQAVRSIMAPGGLIALHDTDNPMFPGCRRAVYEQHHTFELAAHIPDLTIFRVLPGQTAAVTWEDSD